MAPLAPKAVLTCPIWHWGVYYIQMVQEVMDGTWVYQPVLGRMAGWRGRSLSARPMVPDDVKAMTETEVAAFKAGEKTIFTIFTGPINDQEGAERVAAGTG